MTKATTGKGNRHAKGPQPAKYRHPKSGATWSGKGRAPAWLINVKNRAKFLIDAEVSPVEAPVASKASRKTNAVAKKATATNKVVRKVAAKKGVVKVPTAKKVATTVAKKVQKKVEKKAPVTKSVTVSKKVAAKRSGVVAKNGAAEKAARKVPAVKEKVSTPAAVPAPESVIPELTV
ncbi:histone protein [Caballeronia sordidicola]|uniref:Histone protein n=1 Tax=Caballeronia sordidicola TaxID=196367 RepID=A0A242N7X0_CABSO|nr:histone protein [Caballeronia sordidicola]